jgi:N-acetylneuraminic acid mutarotase
MLPNFTRIKRTLIFSFFTLLGLSFNENINAQINSNSQWTFMKGDSSVPGYPVYGTKGVAAPENKPGARGGGIKWTDQSGNLWLYGGSGLPLGNNLTLFVNYPALADVWKFSPATNQWTWMTGSTGINTLAIYGNKGIASINNTPGIRNTNFNWVDQFGKLWMYGGTGYGASGLQGQLNNFWKFDPVTNLWAWMYGDSTINNYNSIYGTQGISSPTNKLGVRNNSAGAIDGAGNMWIMGGNGKAVNGSTGDLDDLWKYNTTNNQWTWIGGGNIINKKAVYGTLGTSNSNNSPGARQGSKIWFDTTGNLWLYGGYGYTTQATNGGYMCDLWKFNVTTNIWTWMNGDSLINKRRLNGILGVPSASTTPGARVSFSLETKNNNVFLFGGSNISSDPNTIGSLGDMWKLDLASLQWSWIKGDSTLNSYTYYGVKGLTSSTNKLGSREIYSGWNDNNGNLWFFGGKRQATGINTEVFPNDDLWKYNISSNNWTWVNGNNITQNMGVYGVKGYAQITNKPGARQGANSWRDSTGRLWLFGGYGYASGILNGQAINNNTGELNDLWNFNPASNIWTWVGGDDTINAKSVYGTRGVYHPTNKPSARQNATAVVGTDGNFWLFGGSYLDKNELWKYNINNNQWAWISGDSSINHLGIYGTLGVAAAGNKPGGRARAVSWVDNSGNFWLWGGEGWDSNGALGYLNDLWKYNPTTDLWTWVKGDKTINKLNKTAPFGSTGTSDPMNQPGARFGASSWKDTAGYFWLFGGYGYGFFSATFLNELWKYNPVTNIWTWVNGDLISGNLGYYGTQGVSSLSTRPGGRASGNSWIDLSGDFWIFGGSGFSSISTARLNDLWKYSPAVNRWTWMKGNNSNDEPGVYGIQQIPSNSNKPGCRGFSNASWMDKVGNLWLFGGGGNGYSYTNNLEINVDLWKFGNYVQPNEICSGSNTSFIANIGGTGYQWQASSDNTNFSNLIPGVNYAGTNTNNLQLVNAPLSFNGFKYRCVSNIDTSNIYTVIINSFGLVPTVSINVSSNNICIGSSITFTANSINGGSSPNYQWQINGVNAGNNSATFTSSNLQNNDQVKVIMTSSLSCASPDTATSNTINMSLIAAPFANAGNDVSICAGSSAQLSGNGGTSYSWNPTSGLSNPNIANPIAAPTSTTAYVLTATNGSCTSRDTVLVTVNTSAVANVSITSSSSNICSGTSVTFTATSINGGPTPTYQWKVNGINAGTNNPTFTTNSLQNISLVSVAMTSSLSCATPLSDTAIISVAVTPSPIANAGNDVTICAGTNTQLNGSGGTNYSWSPATGLSNANIANPIATALINTAYVLTVSNGICVSKDTVLVIVAQPSSPSISISTDSNNICSGSNVTFTAVALNAGANPSYQWQVNGINVGTNSATFSSNSLQNNAQVKVIVTSNGCTTTPVVTSNTITINVTALAQPLVTLNTNVLTVINADAAAVYTWQILTNTVWGNVTPTASGTNYTITQPGEYRVKAEKAACSLYSASQVSPRTNTLDSTLYYIYLNPNPAKGLITVYKIVLSQNWISLDVINLQGQRVLPSKDIRGLRTVPINVGNLASGLYFVRLTNEDGRKLSYKFVKE